MDSVRTSSHGRVLNEYGLLVSAPTGQRSMTFPLSSESSMREMYVPTSDCVPRPVMPSAADAADLRREADAARALHTTAHSHGATDAPAAQPRSTQQRSVNHSDARVTNFLESCSTARAQAESVKERGSASLRAADVNAARHDVS